MDKTDNGFFPGNKPRSIRMDADMLEQGLFAPRRDGTSLVPDFIGGIDPDLLPDDEERAAEAEHRALNAAYVARQIKMDAQNAKT